MAGLELPGGIRIDAPDPTAAQIVTNLAPLLVGISNQLDLLVQMECGLLKRETVKKELEARIAQMKAQANGKGTSPLHGIRGE